MEMPLALIIEDHLDIALTYAEALSEAGYEASIIRRGDIAMKRLAATVPALVILDLHLPVVEGSHLLARIEHDARLADTRVIVVTAHSEKILKLSDRADLLLFKPVGYEQLRDLAIRLRPPAQVTDGVATQASQAQLSPPLGST
jgi:DNA-binding response OmpR family regulator